MPQIFRFGEYWIYFWTNENEPLEPVHIHVAKGAPTANATKIWITSTGNCLLCNNNSRIPNHTLRNIMRMIEARHDDVIRAWLKYFGEIRLLLLILTSKEYFHNNDDISERSRASS